MVSVEVAMPLSVHRYRPTPVYCPECESIEACRTSERMGETFYLCRDCDHVWSIDEHPALPPLMTHSVARTLKAIKHRRKPQAPDAN